MDLSRFKMTEKDGCPVLTDTSTGKEFDWGQVVFTCEHCGLDVTAGWIAVNMDLPPDVVKRFDDAQFRVFDTPKMMDFELPEINQDWDTEAPKEDLTKAGRELVLAVWREQEDYLGLDGPEVGTVDDWISNRTYPDPIQLLNRAAAGDVAAISEVRTEAGVPLLK